MLSGLLLPHVSRVTLVLMALTCCVELTPSMPWDGSTFAQASYCTNRCGDLGVSSEALLRDALPIANR